MDSRSLMPPVPNLGSESDSDEEFFDTILKWYIKYEGGELSPDVDQLLSVGIKEVTYMKSLNDAEFTLKFMISKTEVDSLLSKIVQNITSNNASDNTVSLLQQLLLTLRFYVQGSIPVTDFLDISKPTASRIIQDMSEAISKLSNEYLSIRQGNAQKFKNIANIPNVLGVINCTTVYLHLPATEENNTHTEVKLELYVQAVCDADLRFINMKVYWPGVALHSITKDTVMKEYFALNPLKNYLLGNSRYPCKKYLLTPVRDPSNEAEDRYNKSHLKTWKTIEKAFALWKQRFTVVARPMRDTLWNVHRIITATAVLHNICMDRNLQEPTKDFDIMSNYNEVHNRDADDKRDANGKSDEDNSERNIVINSFRDIE